MLLRQIDGATRSEHSYLEASDRVFFLREYTSGRDYSFGATNSLISNLKKPVSLRGEPQWRFKVKAIRRCADELRATVGNPEAFTWVPVPPSKAKPDPLYDDRLVQILTQAFPGADVRELVVQPGSAVASHSTTARPDPHALAAGYVVDAQLGKPAENVVVFDDILTTGSHFKAMASVLSRSFPEITIFGLFLARRVFP